MALFLRIALLVVLQQSLTGSFDSSDSLSAYSRNLAPKFSERANTYDHIKVPGLYDVYYPLADMSKIPLNDCDFGLRNKDVMKAAFSRIRADSGTIYQGHVVKKEDQACFRGFIGYKENSSLKKCLEFADDKGANSFYFDQGTNYCQLFSSWREHKFRECRRGTEEKIYYVINSEPSNHKPCRGVTISFQASYTATGNVQIVGTTKHDYCCCDVDRINLYYLGSDHEMTIVPEVPKFTYVYPAVDKGAWLNYTTVSVYASGTLIMRTEYVPDRDL